MLRIHPKALTHFRSLFALAILVLALSLLSDKFLTPENGWNILRQISVNLCLSTGMTLIILAGGIDLSVGAQLPAVARQVCRLRPPDFPALPRR